MLLIGSALARPVWPALWALVVFLSGCSARLTDVECDALLDHYTESLLRGGAVPRLSAAEIAHKQEQVRQVARERPEFDFAGCARHVARSQWTCAMAAPGVDEIERCLISRW